MKNLGKTVLSRLLLLFFIFCLPAVEAMQPNQNNPSGSGRYPADYHPSANIPGENDNDEDDNMEDEDQEEPDEEAQDQELDAQPTNQQATVGPVAMDEEEEIDEDEDEQSFGRSRPQFPPRPPFGTRETFNKDMEDEESDEHREQHPGFSPPPLLQAGPNIPSPFSDPFAPPIPPLLHPPQFRQNRPPMPPPQQFIQNPPFGAPAPPLLHPSQFRRGFPLQEFLHHLGAPPQPVPAQPPAPQAPSYLEFEINDQNEVEGIEEIPTVTPAPATNKNNADTKETNSKDIEQKKKMRKIKLEEEIEKLAEDALYEILLCWLGSSDINQDTLSRETLITLCRLKNAKIFEKIFDDPYNQYTPLRCIVQYADAILKGNKYPLYPQAIRIFLKLIAFNVPENGETRTIRIEQKYALFCLLQAHKLLCDAYGANSDNQRLILIRNMIDAVITKYHPNLTILGIMPVMPNTATLFRLPPFVIHCEYFPLADRLLTHLLTTTDRNTLEIRLETVYQSLLELTSSEIDSNDNEKIQLITKVITLLLPIIAADRRQRHYFINRQLEPKIRNCIMTTIFTLLRIRNLNTFFAGLQRNSAVHEAIINQMVSPVTFARLQAMHTDGSRSFLAYLRRQANLVYEQGSVMPVGQALLIAIRLGDTERIKTILRVTPHITASYAAKAIQSALNNNNFQLAQALIQRFRMDLMSKRRNEYYGVRLKKIEAVKKIIKLIISKNQADLFTELTKCPDFAELFTTNPTKKWVRLAFINKRSDVLKALLTYIAKTPKLMRRMGRSICDTLLIKLVDLLQTTMTQEEEQSYLKLIKDALAQLTTNNDSYTLIFKLIAESDTDAQMDTAMEGRTLNTQQQHRTNVPPQTTPPFIVPTPPQNKPDLHQYAGLENTYALLLRTYFNATNQNVSFETLVLYHRIMTSQQRIDMSTYSLDALCSVYLLICFQGDTKTNAPIRNNDNIIEHVRYAIIRRVSKYWGAYSENLAGPFRYGLEEIVKAVLQKMKEAPSGDVLGEAFFAACAHNHKNIVILLIQAYKDKLFSQIDRRSTGLLSRLGNLPKNEAITLLLDIIKREFLARVLLRVDRPSKSPDSRFKALGLYLFVLIQCKNTTLIDDLFSNQKIKKLLDPQTIIRHLLWLATKAAQAQNQTRKNVYIYAMKKLLRDESVTELMKILKSIIPSGDEDDDMDDEDEEEGEENYKTT